MTAAPPPDAVSGVVIEVLPSGDYFCELVTPAGDRLLAEIEPRHLAHALPGDVFYIHRDPARIEFPVLEDWTQDELDELRAEGRRRAESFRRMFDEHPDAYRAP